MTTTTMSPIGPITPKTLPGGTSGRAGPPCHLASALLRDRRNRHPAASFPNGKPLRRHLMGDIKQQTSSAARAVGEAVGHKAEEVADRSRQAGAEGVSRAARTAGAVADAVADVPAVADYVRGAAQKIERLA